MLPNCENDYEALCVSDPAQALAVLEDPAMETHNLTFFVEYAATNLLAGDIAPVLCRLAKHKKAVVREGVIYGLAWHTGREDVIAAVQLVADNTNELAELRALAAMAIEEAKNAALVEERTQLEKRVAEINKQTSRYGWCERPVLLEKIEAAELNEADSALPTVQVRGSDGKIREMVIRKCGPKFAYLSVRGQAQTTRFDLATGEGGCRDVILPESLAALKAGVNRD